MKFKVLPVVPDPVASRGFDAVADAFDQLRSAVMLDVKVLQPQTINTTDTRVLHGLGRRPIGYFLVQAPSDTRVFDGTTPESKDAANYISLRLSTAARVTLAIF